MPEMLIGGEWRQGAAREELEVLNPATEEVVDTVPAGSPDDVEFAVASAKRAFIEWSRTDVEKRAAVLARAAELIEDNARDLAAVLTSEQGKPLAEAMGEVTHLAHGVHFYAEAATKVRGAYQELPSTLGPAYGLVIRRPMGVCAAITPLQLSVDPARDQGRARHWPPVTRSSPSPPRRRRWRRWLSRGCSPRRGCPTGF